MFCMQRFIVFAIFLTTTLFADWDPRSLLQEGLSYSSQDRAYTSLKNKVKKALYNSWCSQEKIDLLMDLAYIVRPKVCVDIGTCTGSCTLPIAATLKMLHSGKVYAIDAWSNAVAVQNLCDDDPNKKWWAHLDMASLYKSFRSLIKEWSVKKFCVKIYKPSEVAISDIPASIDFLHLDGDYSETGSLRDVELYLPKVRSGGYILLSNLYMMIGREQPKIRSFCLLCETCEIVAAIDNDNTVLFKKS